jgi:hypothetical protein
MSFIGKTVGFAQRHVLSTKTPYCPSFVEKLAGSFVRSPVTLDTIRADVEAFSGPTYHRPEDPLLEEVISAAHLRFRLNRKVCPIHLNDLPDMRLDTDSSSPGIPWKDLGYTSKRQVLDDPSAFTSIRRFWHLVKNGYISSLPDCSAFLRSHLVEEGDVKVRAVWGYPATVSFAEACFALPLITAFKSAKTPIAYGYDTATGGVGRIRSRFLGHRHYLGMDFKSFDKTVPAWLIRECFNILLQNIDFRKYRDKGTPEADKLLVVWNSLVKYFVYTPIRLCDGSRYRKNRGVASGSYFTQLIDSIANWIVTQYSLKKLGHVVLDCVVFGDDSLVATDKELDFERYSEVIALFGMFVNLKKSIQSTNLGDITFLGYYLCPIPFRPEPVLWSALLYPETADRSFDEFATRSMGLLIANFGYHKRFDSFCRSVVSRPFERFVTPSQRRFLAVLGLDQLPATPPTHLKLFYMSAG